MVQERGMEKIKLKKINVYSDPNNKNQKPSSGEDLFINLLYDNLHDYSNSEIRIDLRIENHLGLRVGWLSTTLINKIIKDQDNIIRLDMSIQPWTLHNYNVPI